LISTWKLIRCEAIILAVITAEKNKSIVVDANFFEQLENFAYLTIVLRGHRCVTARSFWPRLVFIDRPSWIVVRNIEEPMRRRVRQLGKECGFRILANERLGRIMNHVLRVSFSGAAAKIPFQSDLLAFADQIRRKEAVGVYLVVITKQCVKSVLLWDACRITSTTAALAETAGCVALFLQHRRDRWFVGAQRRATAIRAVRGMAAMLAHQQRTSRRCTDGGTRE